MSIIKAKPTVSLFSFILLICFSACTPQYQTAYEFLPINNPNRTQVSCTTNCQGLRNGCELQARLDFNACSVNKKLSYTECVNSRQYTVNRKNKKVCTRNCNCEKGPCYLDIKPCLLKHAECYGTCGGKVKATTSCTSNCENADPDKIEMLGAVSDK